jgi:hypothetical protein
MFGNKNLLKHIVVIAIFLYLPVHSVAWGMMGHRIVGEIANSYLTAKARKEIQSILGNESIAMASNWPDFIKSDTSYRYLNPWHYVDVEQGLTYQLLQDSLRADTAVNAYNRLEFVVKQLKNKNLPQNDKLMYLRLLIHIVGDVHQPFHVGRKGDRGGNDIKVTWFGEQSNMHRIWDEELIKHQELSYTEYTNAINFATPAQRSEWQKQSMTEWFNESFQISEKLHADVKAGDKLSYNYNFKHVGTLNQQLLKGGVRLAGLLNQIFGS